MGKGVKRMQEPSPIAVALGGIRSIQSWLRWSWRQLTSMSTALVLLLLLAIAAIPGSLFPQRGADPNGVKQFLSERPQQAQLLDALGFFDVYSSAWFSAVYLLLFVSLIGCIARRAIVFVKQYRLQPVPTPKRLDRMSFFERVRMDYTQPGSSKSEYSSTNERIRDVACEMLHQKRYRVSVFSEGNTFSVSAQRGRLKEFGNISFHVSLIGVLVSFFVGGAGGHHGQKVVVVGQSFINSFTSYDSFSAGRDIAEVNLDPFAFRLDKFEVVYEMDNPNALGTPIDYKAFVTLHPGSDREQEEIIRVNHPLEVGPTQIFLLGNGYAPVVTIRDAQGQSVFEDAVVFIPQDSQMSSLGFIKVPDGLSQQMGMIGFLYPTVERDHATQGILRSTFPDLQDPVLSLNVYVGDLGLDDAIAQSVYTLNTERMTQVAGAHAPEPALFVELGQTVDLPEGLGTLTFSGVERYASFEARYDPASGWVLAFTLMCLSGLLLSFFSPRRRVWVKVSTVEQGKKHVATIEYAGLARGDDPRLSQAVGNVMKQHQTYLGEHVELKVRCD